MHNNRPIFVLMLLLLASAPGVAQKGNGKGKPPKDTSPPNPVFVHGNLQEFLTVADEDGGNHVNVPLSVAPFGVSWIPGGEMSVLVETGRDEAGVQRLLRVDLSVVGTDIETVESVEFDGPCDDPSQNPNPGDIRIICGEDSGFAGMLLLLDENRVPIPLVSHDNPGSRRLIRPTWDGFGEQVAFQSNTDDLAVPQGSPMQLTVIEVSPNNEVVHVTYLNLVDFKDVRFPAFANQNNWIAFVGETTGNWDDWAIHRVDLDELILSQCQAGTLADGTPTRDCDLGADDVDLLVPQAFGRPRFSADDTRLSHFARVQIKKRIRSHFVITNLVTGDRQTVLTSSQRIDFDWRQ